MKMDMPKRYMMFRSILKTPKDRERALVAVGICLLDPPTEVIVQPYKKKLSREAQNRHWSILRQVAAQLKDEDGNYHSPEVWHLHLCSEFLGTDVVKMGGRDKIIPRSSANLSSHEFAEFDDQIEAWATERGVNLVFENEI